MHFQFIANGQGGALQESAGRDAVQEAAMDSFIGFAEVTGAILGALGLALGLEWFSLNGLMRLMPARRDASVSGAKTTKIDI
jgi:hypothetical protein